MKGFKKNISLVSRKDCGFHHRCKVDKLKVLFVFTA